MSKGIKIKGTKNNDELIGTIGDDTIDGGAGNDLLYGGSDEAWNAGNDTFIFGKKHGHDTIQSNHQTEGTYDSFQSGSRVAMTKDVLVKDVKLDIVKVMITLEDGTIVPQWNLNITLKSAADVITIEDYLYVGQDGRGEIHFADGTNWTYADIVSKVSGDADFKEYVAVNGPLKSYLTGHNGNDVLVGTNATEFIDGSAGNDSISALGGDDSIFGGLGNDTIDCGSGDDFVRDQFGNNVVVGGNGHDVILTGEGNDSLDGGDSDDNLFCGGGSNTVNGGDGNDTIYTEGGVGVQNKLYGDAGDDDIYAGQGKTLLDGGDGDDRLTAYEGNDTLLGGSGNDTLSAGSFVSKGPLHNAVLDGGAGADILTGLFGNQTYVFNKGYGSDVIYARHDDRADRQDYYEHSGLRKGDLVQFGSFVKVSDIKLDIVQESQIDADDASYTQTWWHLDLTINGTSDNLRIDDYLTKTPSDRGTIKFADGTSWSYADVLSKVSTDVDTIAFNAHVATLTGTPAAHSADLFGV